MANHFSAIGLPLQTREDFVKLLNEVEPLGLNLPSTHGDYIQWSPGGGPELWLQRDAEGRTIGCNPHFAGASRLRIAVTKLLPDEAYLLDGALYAWAEPPGDEPLSGEYPFVFDVPDFDLIQEKLSLPQIVSAQIAAFAHELSCFADDAAFHASQESKVKMAAESFIPSGLFTPSVARQDDERESKPQAMAIFNGHITASEVRVNAHTQAPFLVLSVQTLGGTFDVVADSSIVEGAPIVGGVASGTLWLSGRIIESINL